MTDYLPTTVGRVAIHLSGFGDAVGYAEWLLELTADLETRKEIEHVLTAALSEEFSPDETVLRDGMVGKIAQIIWEA